ncbi:hypothetical protein DSUL_90016 [Desulfovibrionales bacterium]
MPKTKRCSPIAITTALVSLLMASLSELTVDWAL